jgi:hypothetical protein
MENGDKTAERLGMASVKEGNHTHAAVDIDWRASQIYYLCRWQVVYSHQVILNCLQGTVASQIDHMVEPHSLSLVEIPLSTWSVNKDGGTLR